MRLSAPVEHLWPRHRPCFGKQRRTDDCALLHDLDVAEPRLQQCQEFKTGHLAYVERIHRRSRGRVDVSIRCADDEAAAWPKHPLYLTQEVTLTIEVLDRLK